MLHFPFFANTFSIAFHYMTALQEIYTDDSISFNKYVLEQDWDEPTSNIILDNENIFYATLEAIKQKINESEKTNYYYRPISHYRPRYIFAEYHPHLDINFSCVNQNNTNISIFTKDIVTKSKNSGVNKIEVFTDIPTQAKVIKVNLSEWGFPERNIVILDEPVDAIKYYEASTKILRLFYYGAPTTSRMLRDKFRYTSFELSPQRNETIDETMITCICLYKPDNNNYTDDINNDLEQLFLYNKLIFDTAFDKSRHIDFINILWAYNRFAERKQHSATFANTEDFAKCLEDHHDNLPESLI